MTLLFFSQSLLAQDFSTQQMLLFAVDPLNFIQVMSTQGPAPLFRITNLDCASPSTLESSGLTYTVITNEYNKKIIAYIDRPMMPHTCLTLCLAPPAGSRSLGARPLSPIPQDMVIALSQTAGFGLDMHFTFSASLKAGVIPPQARIVTLTLTDN